jgi:hypothetical protein
MDLLARRFDLMFLQTGVITVTTANAARRNSTNENAIDDLRRLRHKREKELRDPKDVLIEADRLRQQLKKRPARRRGTPQ